jgi:hypothetical protein
MRRRPKESRRATLTRNGIVAPNLLITDAKPPTHAREIAGKPTSAASVSSRRLRDARGTEVEARALGEPTAANATSIKQQESTENGDEAQGEVAIARALVMAQRMADQTVEEARVKARSMVGEAEARAKSMTEQAQMRAREVTEAAQMRAREVTEAAQMRAREVTEAAQMRARELTEGLETRYKERIQSAEARARVAEEQARMQIAQATEQVARRRQELESSIDALRAFERDYRARLRDFVETQLKGMDQEVEAIDQEVKAIDQQVKVIEGSKDVPPSPELIATSLQTLKMLILNYATLVRTFAQGQLNQLEHVIPTGSLAPPEPNASPESAVDPRSST